ncbi:hypothetical protein CDD81_2635 [Ophiocordyceps australis]|uniref:non-specific serine/threonine protein kinase n=1 Tax=Ophiocordyceps australis TaxID=1399860 RepID=A0A2C5XTD5_9HYPO|nr:hypothetical protein CDD81_2635 [Ophiocordyceps australis]
MGDGPFGSGWTTVGHKMSAPSGSLGRVWEIEQELRERDAISAWDRDDDWPGVYRPPSRSFDAKRFDGSLIELGDLGIGAFGSVDKIQHGGVALARKRITRTRGLTLSDLRQEALTMRKLDHCHVVKLVATYAPRPFELCLLIWPAALCSLSSLLQDIECLRLGNGDREDIVQRLYGLHLRDDDAPAPPLGADDTTTYRFLCSLIGCLARALAYCHAKGVRHLDIKPSNILLNPNRVYLADFGISQDVSDRDHTTIDGAPGTEKWRAPELHGSHGSSMQLSDIYSLGLVYLNIATVLYSSRLADFEDSLRYSHCLCLDERLRIREEKVKKHLDGLSACCLATPRFALGHDGQETVRPRPLVTLIAQMLSRNPRSRPSAEKADEKLSMLGGIYQIYHSDCCKRPARWMEDKWDKKLTMLASLKAKNEQQRQRILELEGKDETYEARIENAHLAHKDRIDWLQKQLREAEDECRRLEKEKSGRKKSHARGYQGSSRSASRCTSQDSRANCAASSPPPILGKTLQVPMRSAAQPWSRPAAAKSPPPRGRPGSCIETSLRPGPTRVAQAPRRPSPSESSTGYKLRSRGSGSRLPLPVTPVRCETPALGHDPSMSESSMASSIFSRRSIETAPTPAYGSPQLQHPAANESSAEPQWTHLPAKPSMQPCHVAAPPNLGLSTVPLSRRRRLGFAPEDIVDRTARPIVPTLQSTKSWADVAKSSAIGKVRITAVK